MKYITLYDKNGNALVVREAHKGQFVGKGYTDTPPKSKKEKK